MSKRFLFFTSFVLVLTLASASYGNSPFFKLDFDEPTDVNTEPGFTSFLLEDSGSEVNGITIEFLGNLDTHRRDGPNQPDGDWYHEIYRDFIFAYYPDGIEMTLWGLGAGRKCDITIYAFDAKSSGTRVANWSTPTESNIIQTWFNGNFGDILQWPYYLCGHKECYAFTGTGTADELGRIILTSTIDPCSQENEPFAYVNALIVSPNSTGPAYIPVEEATIPRPVNRGEDVPPDVILSWKAGAYADKHDVYFGTDETKVTDANRSNPLGVLVSQNHSTTTYNPPGFLDLNTAYYWRIDEVNAAPDYTIFKGEVWSFRTAPYFVVENFDSYEDNYALRNVWKDYTTNGTSAEVSVETAIVRDGNSMRYRYKNNLPPYYSEADVNIADLGIDDSDWLGIGAEALMLYFYGEPTNPIGEQMYVKLTDGDNPPKTATVMYSNMNDARLKQWNQWSIALTEFTDVNLANVARITIGFGDVSPGNAGTVYFEDIVLDIEVEVLPEVAGEVDVNTVYQELEGFGASGGWHEWEILSMPQSERDEFYDIVFDELGLDIYRLRNTYDNNVWVDYLENSAEIVAAAKERNPSLKIMISCWSPPAYLKSNDKLAGGTLKKDTYGNYMYNEFAQWWADSLDEWSSHGVVADYVNIQNEPDFETESWSTCRFDPMEDPNIAGYDQAFEAVYAELYYRMGSAMPKLLAPETAGFWGLSSYIDALIDTNHVYGYAHHLYNGGGAYNYPDGYISSMTNFAASYGYKPLLQTEFSKGGEGDVTTFTEAMNLAHLMHNALVFENVSSYCYWELFWTLPKGLVSHYYIINPVYYAFKHYSAFTDPGWYRVGASTDLGSLGNLRISAFKSPDNSQLTIVIINLAYNNINLTLDVNGFSPDSSEIYRTSETENTAYIGPYYENGSLMLPARSITTIHSPALSNCDGILSSGYGLMSDIHPDCYVNYEDLKIITDYWLNTDCGLYGDCEGADFEPTDGVVNLFDLSTFAEQWMWCNDPEDPNCTANW